jgi:hypothetical protein
MARSSNSEEILNQWDNGHVGKDHEDRLADGGERAEKKPEKQGPVGFWHL